MSDGVKEPPGISLAVSTDCVPSLLTHAAPQSSFPQSSSTLAFPLLLETLLHTCGITELKSFFS